MFTYGIVAFVPKILGALDITDSRQIASLCAKLNVCIFFYYHFCFFLCPLSSFLYPPPLNFSLHSPHFSLPNLF